MVVQPPTNNRAGLHYAAMAAANRGEGGRRGEGRNFVNTKKATEMKKVPVMAVYQAHHRAISTAPKGNLADPTH